MIRIIKNTAITNTPISLRPPFNVNFNPEKISRVARYTSMRRNELIRKGSYTDTGIYNSRYKMKDIKILIRGLYKNKCAYCEQKVEQSHVEHYRPKQTYYWLAFSWDNLLCACDDCNQHKSTHFRINGPLATLTVDLNSIKNINTLSASYDLSEMPDMVNPEVTDPTGHLVFSRDGKISSANARFDYTIDKCQIDRTYLRDNRKKVFDDFIEDLKEEISLTADKAQQIDAINTLVRKFIRESKKPNNEYLAFRNYVINNWLKVEIKKLNN